MIFDSVNLVEQFSYSCVQNIDSQFVYTEGNIWRGIYKKSCIQENCIRFCDKMKYAEDTLFEFVFAYNAKQIVKVDVITYYYRQHISSAVHRKGREACYDRYQSWHNFNLQLCSLPVKDRFLIDLDNKKEYSKRQAIRILFFSASSNEAFERELEKLVKDGTYPPKFRFEEHGETTQIIRVMSFFFPIKLFLIVMHRIYVLIRRVRKYGE